MSYASEPVTPAKARPGAVTISSYLLYLVAFIEVIGVVAALASMGEVSRIYEEAYAGTDLDGVGSTFAVVGSIVGTVLGLLFAVGLVILAIFNNRGKNGSRITTWVIGGLLLCCSGFGLIGAAGSFNMDSGNTNVPDAEEVQNRVGDALPWLMPVQIVTSLVVLLALLVALILLALPPSNEFFRKPPADWQPPVGAQPGYQAYQAYPPAGTPPYPPAQPPASPPAAPPDDRPGPAGGGG